MLNEQQFIEIIRQGTEKMKPMFMKITEATHETLLECYLQGFNDCYKSFTGRDLQEGGEE